MTEMVSGLKELRRAVSSIDRDMGKELTRVLKAEVAAPVVAISRGLAPVGPSRGAHGQSGRLRDSIKGSVRGGSVFVVSSPPLNPSPGSPRGYAPVVEYGDHGVRSFLRKGVTQFERSGGMERAGNAVLDWVAKEWKR